MKIVTVCWQIVRDAKFAPLSEDDDIALTTEQLGAYVQLPEQFWLSNTKPASQQDPCLNPHANPHSNKLGQTSKPNKSNSLHHMPVQN